MGRHREAAARIVYSRAFWVVVLLSMLLALGLLGMRPLFALASTRLANVLDGNQSGLSDPKVERVGDIFCYVEVLTADRPSAYGYIAPRGCVPSGEFKRGERIVWRFEIMDTATSARVTPEQAASVRVRLPHGEEVEADWKQRGEGRVPDAPWTWDVCWDTPLDYPLGTLDYSILLTANDGQTRSWKPPSLVDPTRGIDSRIRIVN